MPAAELPIAVVAMTNSQLPAAETFVEMTVADEPVPGVRVVRAAGDLVTLSMPLAAAPDPGATVTLRWPAGVRGRYALRGRVVSVDENRVDVRAAGAPDVEQHRSFVRGGGGEHILLLAPGKPDCLGWIRDISEQGVRAHFAGAELTEGDEIRFRVQLDHEVIELSATTVKVGSLRQRLPRYGPMSVEVVAVFTPDEPQARVIRRYVFRQQLMSRTRPAG